ncbi:MAG: hypothetical protein H7062_23010 [Candidatus Saccharimonas sp.]|nr:hypothetical protein [Planctomycetaceae bacterium]
MSHSSHRGDCGACSRPLVDFSLVPSLCYPLFPRTVQALSAFVLVTMLVLNFDAASPAQSVSVWYGLVLLGSLAYRDLRFPMARQ